MKGIVFTEFIEMVEDKFGFETADNIIAKSDLPSGGAYTSVGTYEINEMAQLLTNLSKETNMPADKLLHVFGKHLFGRFYKIYPHFFEGKKTVFDFLLNIENYIHVEVLKLYPDAQLPAIDAKITGNNTMDLTYSSKRKLSDLALGLIEGCIDFFKEDITIEAIKVEDDGSVVRFNLRKNS